ncbi:MAG: tetratricopeptide repeat protein [Deltaproteobacteria bacterium]|nr:tetratricopeptide repeat protein [Deltaproteobacteria bacterium]MCL5277432.1 tetratricopeptide repeat protein [Deltaproteobacteria bacterium]
MDNLTYYLEILKLEPENVPALKGVAEIYKANRQWSELVETYEKLFSFSEGDDERLSYLTETADVYYYSLNDSGRAIEFYLDALEFQPANQTVIDTLIEIFDTLKRLPELTIMLEGKALLSKDDGAAAGITDRIVSNYLSLKMYDEALARLSASKAPPYDAVRAAYEGLNASGMLATIFEYRGLFIDALQSGGEAANAELAGLYCLLADMYERVLGDIYEGACSYEAALGLGPDGHAQAAPQLYRIYTSPEYTFADEPVLFIPVLLRMREHVATDAVPGIDKKIGMGYLELGEPASAMPFLKTALSASPDDKELLYALLDVSTSSNDAEGAYETVRKLIDVEHDGAREADLYRKALPILIGKKDYDTAKRLITSLVSLTGDQSHYALLEQLYTDSGDYGSLVTYYLERLNGREDDRDSAALWASLGDAYLKGFSHYEYAIDSYSRALALSPDNAGYLEALAGLYSSLERWEEAEHAIARLIQIHEGDDGEKTRLQLMLGDIYLKHTKDHDRAAALYSGVLAQHPDNGTALAALERIYRESSDYANLVKILEKKLSAADDRYDVLIELGSILFDRSMDALQAQNYLWEALELRPSSTYALDVLKRLYETTGDFNGFDRLYSFLIDRTPHTDRTGVELLVKLGHLREEKLAMPEKAISAFEQALSIDPDNNDANLSLAKLYFNAGEWDRAAPRYAFSMDHDVVEKQAVPEFTFEYARVLDKLGRQEQAMQYYQKAFELDGTERRYAEAYGNSAYKNKDSTAVITAFEALLKIPVPDDRRADGTNEVYRKLTDAYEATGDHRAASIYLMKLIEKDPRNMRNYTWLERLAASTNDYSLLASTLKKEAELTEDDDQRAGMILRRASILDENLNDLPAAVKALEEFVKTGKRDLDVYVKLNSLYKKADNREGFVSTAGEILKFQIPAEQKVSLLLELAAVQRDDVQRAAGIYRDVLDIQPDNAAAFSALAALYESSHDYAALSALYEERLHGTQSADDRIDMQKKLAAVRVEKLNDPDGGISVYQDIVKARPSDSEVYPLLESLLLKKGDNALLSQFYRSAASSAAQKEVKLDYFIKSAELLSSRMNDEKGAIQDYESAYGIDRTNSDVLIQLARLTASQHLNDSALAYYREAIKSKAVPDETIAALNYEYGGLLKDSGKPGEAHGAYKNAYNLSPSNIDYRLAYGESAYASGLYKDAYDTLKNITYAHEQGLEPGKLFPLYKILSDISRKLGNTQQAVEYLLRATDINDRDADTLTTLDEMTASLGNFELEIEVLAKLLKVTDGPTDRVRVLMKIAKLKHDKLYDLDGAIPLLREAMTIMPDSAPIYNELIQIYREQSDADNEIDILSKLLKIEKSADDFVATSMRLGEVYAKFKNDPDTAKRYYLEALKREPSSIPALKGLGSIFELQGNFQGMAEMYQKFIKVLLPKEPKKVLPLIKELGALYTTKVDNPELAVQQYQTIVSIESSDIDAHCALADLLSKSKSGAAEAAREYGIVLKHRPGSIQAVRFLAKFYEQKKDYDRVFSYYSALKLLGQEKDMERIFVDANRSKQPKQPKSPVTDDLFTAHLLHIKTRGPLKDIVNAFPDYAGGIFKPDLKSYGVGRQERITSKSAAWQEYGRLQQLLGIKDMDVYHAPKGDFRIVVENTDPPSLIVNTSAFSGMSAEEKTFVLTEYLAYIRSGLTLPVKLGRQRFSQFIGALIAIFSPSAATQHEKDPGLGTVQNAVGDMLSKKQRSALDEPVKKYLKMANHYLEDWFAGIEMTGVRTASFMIGDIEQVFSSLVKWHIGDTSLLSNKEKRKDVFSSSELMQDMLQFYLSDSHFLLRSRLGMSILSV